MKVALLTPAYGPEHGVVGRHVQALSEATARSGGTVQVLLHANRRISSVKYEGVSIARFPPLIPGSDISLSRALWAYLQNHGGEFDLLHAHGEAALPALRVMGDRSCRLIFTPHWYASSQTRLRHVIQGRVHRLDGSVFERAARVLCVSESEALQVRRHAPHARLQIVLNGLDVDSIAAAEPFGDESSPVILGVDRLTRWAGIQRIISALLALPDSYRLVVVGRGRGRGMLEAHADYLKVAERVRFLGAVSDDILHRWMRTAAIVATLKEESLWGGTLLTAVCAETSVLASDIMANREAASIVGMDGIAFVSRRASPFAIAEAIQRFAAAESHPVPDRVPTWTQTAKRVVGIYRSLLPGVS